MVKTTCLKCKQPCEDYELDFNSECPICQAMFANEMKARSGRGLHKKKKSYMDHINSSLQLMILKSAIKVYKIKYRGKDKMIEYLNDLHDVEMTRHVFDELTSPANLRKYNLEWDYKKLDKFK